MMDRKEDVFTGLPDSLLSSFWQGRGTLVLFSPALHRPLDTVFLTTGTAGSATITVTHARWLANENVLTSAKKGLLYILIAYLWRPLKPPQGEGRGNFVPTRVVDTVTSSVCHV
jgi:hypothetical protein